MQRSAKGTGDNGGMKTITNIADRLFRKVEPVDSSFGSEAAGAAVEGAAGETSGQTGAQTKSQTGAAFPAETRTPAFCAIDCPGRCPLELHLRDGELARVSANKAAPACHRGLSMRAWANSPDRLMWPLRRVGPRGSAQFERVTWDEALDEISDQLARIRREHGNESIYLAYTTGQSCTTADPFERLMNCFGGFLDHYNNYSNPQINAMVRSMYGPGALYPGGSELDAAADARLVLVFGASPAETGTGRATWHGAWDRVVGQVGERGGRIVMVDPRRNGSIPKRKGSDQQTVSWLPINPGTDGALAAALLHELAFTHNALDWDFLHERCIGFTDETLPEHWRGMGLSVMDYLRGTGFDHVAKTPAWAAAITGIPANDIRELAAQLATARPVFIMQGWGPQRRSDGEMTSGMIMMLAAALGQVGLPGTNNGMNIAWGGGFLTRVSAGENHIPFRIPAYRFLDATENGEALGAREGVRGLPEASCGNAEDASSAERAQAGCANAEGPGSTQEAPAENDAARGFALTAKASLEQTSHSNRATYSVQHQDSAMHLPSSIKAIICHGGNCLTNQHGDVNRAHRVLGDPMKCEFILNVDVEFTDSARYADIVLPDLFRMEQESAMDADGWGRRIAASTGELGARFERRGAWEVCVELAKRWGIEDAFTEGRTEGEWIRRLYEGDRERSTGLPTFDRLLEERLGAPIAPSRSWRWPIGEATPTRTRSTRRRERSSCSASSSPPRPKRYAAHPMKAPSLPSLPTFPNGARRSSPLNGPQPTGRRNRTLSCARTATDVNRSHSFPQAAGNANRTPDFPQAVAKANQTPNPPATSRFACSVSTASHASIRRGATCPPFRGACRRSSRSTPRTPTRGASQPATWWRRRTVSARCAFPRTSPKT